MYRDSRGRFCTFETYLHELLQGPEQPQEPPKAGEYALFAYGIFLSTQTLESVIGYPFTGRKTPATIKGYTRVRRGPYYVTPKRGHTVRAYVYEGLHREDFVNHLDGVEGTKHRHYDRITVDATLEDGRLVKAQLYVAGPRVKTEIARDHYPNREDDALESRRAEAVLWRQRFTPAVVVGASEDWDDWGW